jgi:hypothetical protein
MANACISLSWSDGQAGSRLEALHTAIFAKRTQLLQSSMRINWARNPGTRCQRVPCKSGKPPPAGRLLFCPDFSLTLRERCEQMTAGLTVVRVARARVVEGLRRRYLCGATAA